MLRVMMKSKIHRATITQADLAYEGSLTVAADLMRGADILPYEMVHVYNISNGERFETYAMEGEAGSGVICLNGAAARKGRGRGPDHHHHLRQLSRRRSSSSTTPQGGHGGPPQSPEKDTCASPGKTSCAIPSPSYGLSS